MAQPLRTGRRSRRVHWNRRTFPPVRIAQRAISRDGALRAEPQTQDSTLSERRRAGFGTGQRSRRLFADDEGARTARLRFASSKRECKGSAPTSTSRKRSTKPTRWAPTSSSWPAAAARTKICSRSTASRSSRAIVRTKTPVVTGIGHTADHHLADEVADLECETPSNAAQFIANLWQSGDEKLARLRIMLDNGMQGDLGGPFAAGRSRGRAGRSRLGASALVALRKPRGRRERRISTNNPVARVARQARRLTESNTRSGRVAGKRVRTAPREPSRRGASVWGPFRSWSSRNAENALALAESRLESSDPESPLARGYAIVTFAGRALRDARDVALGDSIDARLAHGSLGARVETVSAR